MKVNTPPENSCCHLIHISSYDTYLVMKLFQLPWIEVNHLVHSSLILKLPINNTRPLKINIIQLHYWLQKYGKKDYSFIN